MFTKKTPPGRGTGRPTSERENKSTRLNSTTFPSLLQQADYSPLPVLVAKLAEAEAGMEAAPDDPSWVKSFQIWLDCHRKITASKNRFIRAHEQALAATVTGSQVRALVRLRARVGQTEFKKARAAVGVQTGITRMSENEASRLIGKIKNNLQGGNDDI